MGWHCILFVCFVYTVCIIYSSSHFQFCVMSWFCHCTIFTHNLLPYIVNLQSLGSLGAHEIYMYCKMSLIWLAKKNSSCPYTAILYFSSMVLQTVGIIMLYRPSGIGIVSGLWLRGIIVSPIWSLESVNLAKCTCSHHGFLLTSLKLYSGRLFKLAIIVCQWPLWVLWSFFFLVYNINSTVSSTKITMVTVVD